ncbi:MAG: 30S ribosomal protein S20 [Oscillospiraceae bacterium]|nr:30S ribosomal protein S20 [Oscillospiraceae bacterium]
MPNIKSAKKRVRVTKVKTLRNKSLKSELRTALKKAAHSKECILQAISSVDRAVSKGILHRNNAARKKSALARLLRASDSGV